MGGELTVYYMRHGRFPTVTPEGCAKVSLCLMFLVPFKILIILYALTDPVDPTLPICSIEKFYIPTLDFSTNSTATNENQTIYFDLKLWNQEIMNGLIYDPLNLTFSYGAMLQNRSVSATANFTFPGFYQGYKKTAHRRGLAETHPVAAGRRILVETGHEKEELQGFLVSMAILRIELKTAVRFRSMFGKSKRHRLTLGGRVEVNDGGQMVGNKGIELTEFSAAATSTTFGGYYYVHVLLLAFSSAFILAVI